MDGLSRAGAVDLLQHYTPLVLGRRVAEEVEEQDVAKFEPWRGSLRKHKSRYFEPAHITTYKALTAKRKACLATLTFNSD